jgi:acid phosphatase type 7
MIDSDALLLREKEAVTPIRRRLLNAALFSATFSMLATMLIAHEGPDPIVDWIFHERFIEKSRLKARLGPDLILPAKVKIIKDKYGQSLLLTGQGKALGIAGSWKESRKYLPKRNLTAAAWVSINKRYEYGGIVGAIEDNGRYEKGWLLGYDNERFTFSLASKGSDDGDGRLTFIRSKTKYKMGRLYYVVGTYDGKQMRLYVNGQLEADSKAQSGDILYPDKESEAPFVVGGYLDKNESWPHHGRLREVEVFELVALPKLVEKEFKSHIHLTKLAPYLVMPAKLQFVVDPYLQYGTLTTMTVMWESTRISNSRVSYGETAAFGKSAELKTSDFMHEVTLKGLKAETQYFYKVRSEDDKGQIIESKTSTFQTASKPGTPYAFAVISDTQTNWKVAEKVARFAWAQRPNFLLHPGDLVEDGKNKSHWSRQFFPAMRPLISRVPFYPVLGNHERNAHYYYKYMSLPSPEYYYDFQYGNAHFFMIDSNKRVHPASEQYKWLENKLKASTATWKFVCHHHPAYSSDENDYGNLWKGKSTRGDRRIRRLTRLYDRYSVDIVWNGHIHSYERTWPVYKGRVVDTGRGTIYMITGGGGGGLESPGPTRPFFQNNVRRGHHYCMIAVNGSTLEFKAFDIEGRLFDTMTIKKSKKVKTTPKSAPNKRRSF